MCMATEALCSSTRAMEDSMSPALGVRPPSVRPLQSSMRLAPARIAFETDSSVSQQISKCAIFATAR